MFLSKIMATWVLTEANSVCLSDREPWWRTLVCTSVRSTPRHTWHTGSTSLSSRPSVRCWGRAESISMSAPSTPSTAPCCPPRPRITSSGTSTTSRYPGTRPGRWPQSWRPGTAGAPSGCRRSASSSPARTSAGPATASQTPSPWQSWTVRSKESWDLSTFWIETNPSSFWQTDLSPFIRKKTFNFFL